MRPLNPPLYPKSSFTDWRYKPLGNRYCHCTGPRTSEPFCPCVMAELIDPDASSKIVSAKPRIRVKARSRRVGEAA